jgi:hypothetical protein
MTSTNGADMPDRTATANIVQMTQEPNPAGAPPGAFRFTLFHSPDMVTDPVYVAAGDINPLEEGGSNTLSFSISAPGRYHAECTRLNVMGQPIGPVATSGPEYIGDTTGTYQAPLVITLGISPLPV